MEEKDQIREELIQFHAGLVPQSLEKQRKHLDYHVLGEEGELIGGIQGVLFGGHTCLRIDMLWVAENSRGKGLGSFLLHRIEDEAKRYGARLVDLDTINPQAKKFYFQHGYEICGEIEDCPPGFSRFILKKKL